MIKTDFMKLMEKLDALLENPSTSSQPNLADCRMIVSNVRDIRGELEASACLEYNGELTRVQVRTVILRDTEAGKEFLGKSYGHRVQLPGGGYDMDKDHGDILETAIREAYEEFNLILTDVKDTGLNTWRHRVDPWVAKHVEKEEDRWTGYYSYFVVSRVAGSGNNSKPEEIDQWAWLPIEKLKSVNKDLYLYVTSLNEAIHPSHQPRTDVGEVSYLCDSLGTLRKILSRMEIQKTYVPEVRYEVGDRGNTQKVRQMSISTSTDLTLHAHRKPQKWGFGVILDGPELSRYYGLEPYNHADHKLKQLKLNKLVRLTDEAAKQFNGSRVILMLGEYGNRLIDSTNNADLNLYSMLIEFLRTSGYMQKARTLDYYTYPGQNNWRYPPFGRESGWHDARFKHLLPKDIKELYGWPLPFSKNAVPVAEIDAFCDGQFSAAMGEYTTFNEKEERIWVENNLMNFVQIPPTALVGIILPDYFKEDYNKAQPTNYHIAWLKQFAKAKGLRVDWHTARDEVAYAQEMTANNSEETEAVWSAIDRRSSDPKVIITNATKNRMRVLRGIITEKEKEQRSPSSVVATAAVKLAIAEHMQNLTNDNYADKALAALQAAEEYYKATILPNKLSVHGGLKPKQFSELESLFNYYCPDIPGGENIYPATEDNVFNQTFPEIEKDNVESDTMSA